MRIPIDLSAWSKGPDGKAFKVIEERSATWGDLLRVTFLLSVTEGQNVMKFWGWCQELESTQKLDIADESDYELLYTTVKDMPQRTIAAKGPLLEIFKKAKAAAEAAANAEKN